MIAPKKLTLKLKNKPAQRAEAKAQAVTVHQKAEAETRK
jgi:hypothetical protein